MSRRASFRARSNTYFSRHRGDSIVGAVASPLNSPGPPAVKATVNTRRMKPERPPSLQFNPNGSGSFIGLRGYIYHCIICACVRASGLNTCCDGTYRSRNFGTPSGSMSARLPSTPTPRSEDTPLSNSDSAPRFIVCRVRWCVRAWWLILLLYFLQYLRGPKKKERVGSGEAHASAVQPGAGA